jgi:hypothetical protein
MNLKINYPKPELVAIHERYTHHNERSACNKKIITGLRKNRFSIDHVSSGHPKPTIPRITLPISSKTTNTYHKNKPHKYEIPQEEVDMMLIQKKLPFYYKGIKY